MTCATIDCDVRPRYGGELCSRCTRVRRRLELATRRAIAAATGLWDPAVATTRRDAGGAR